MRASGLAAAAGRRWRPPERLGRPKPLVVRCSIVVVDVANAPVADGRWRCGESCGAKAAAYQGVRLRTLAKARMQRSLEAAHLRPSCIVSIGHRAMCMRLCAMLVSGKSIHSRPHVLLRGTAPLANIDMFQGCRGALSQVVRVHHRGEETPRTSLAQRLCLPLLAT